jgi:Ribbon-helix-helix protein, copG family
MIRTQIHLSEDEVELLDRERARSGASRSELIRRAINAVYGGREGFELPRSIGIASDGSLSGEDSEAWVEREWRKDLRR